MAADGTSASTPAIAGLFALWDQQRMDTGQPRLGFPTPLLYRTLDAVYNKVTDAQNKCTEDECCPTGFVSSASQLASPWDAVTGFGTLNVSVLFGV